MASEVGIGELLERAHVVRLPLTTRFRGVTEREAVLFEGPQGWCEFSPFTEYGDDESATWLAAALDFGWHVQPTPVRERIPVNATVPAVPAERVAEVLSHYDGCRTAKVKVAEPGQSRADDVARVREVRRVLGRSGRIRVDANGGWNVDEAEHALRELEPFDLEYAEQPCATVDELAELRDRLAATVDIPLAADESVRKATDPLAVARAGAADLVVVKAQPLGGVPRALRIVGEAGLPAVVSSAIDTSVGLAQGAWLAACLPSLDFDCGLGTGALLAADVTGDPLVAVGGSIPVRRVVPQPELLARHVASAPRRDWWLDRVRRCHAVLAAR